tara:strand:- start:217 stop:933 length:717 start_codon:yes stop_codon:yes gene_type:complete
MPRKRKNKRYFTTVTEMAINAYNNCDDDRLKNKIYNRFIHYPFDKLSENVIHTYKTYYFDIPYEDVKASVVAFLNEKIHKFNGDNGRAFSYFTVVARNYLFNENNANYARMKSREGLDVVDSSRNIVNEVVSEQMRESKSDFIDHYTQYIDYHLDDIFSKDRDRAIADSINELFKTRNDLYSYNKKALYILIRERTGVHTQYITKVVGKMKHIYVELYTQYNKFGHIDMLYKLKGIDG